MLQITRRPPDWTEHAACDGRSGGSTDPWHDEERYDEARAICRACPVRDQCEADGLGLLQVIRIEGIWAGHTPAELRALARSRGLPSRLIAQHGTRTMYVNGKCRCPDCRRANADGEAARRAAIRLVA